MPTFDIKPSITYSFKPSAQMATVEAGWCPVVTSSRDGILYQHEIFYGLVFDTFNEALSKAVELAKSKKEITQESVNATVKRLTNE